MLKKEISFSGVFSIASGAMITPGIFILPCIAFSNAGGDYYIVNKTFGPLLGTISGFQGWVALIKERVCDICYFRNNVFVLPEIVGVKEAAVFQIIMVVGLLSLMIMYIVTGFPKIQSSFYRPFLTVGINHIIITSGFIVISFGRLLNIATISEEVKIRKGTFHRE